MIMNYKTNTKERICEIFINVLKLESKDMVKGSGLIERLSIKSLQALQLIVEIENAFGIVILDEEALIRKLDNIDELQKYIDDLLGNN